jgi:hypothetical protein
MLLTTLHGDLGTSVSMCIWLNIYRIDKCFEQTLARKCNHTLYIQYVYFSSLTNFEVIKAKWCWVYFRTFIVSNWRPCIVPILSASLNNLQEYVSQPKILSNNPEDRNCWSNSVRLARLMAGTTLIRNKTWMQTWSYNVSGKSMQGGIALERIFWYEMYECVAGLYRPKRDSVGRL